MAVAFASVALLAPVTGGQDQDGLEDEFTLLEEDLADDEVKSASKYRQSIFWSPSTITVFTREEIRTSGATVLWDLLRRVPGFDVYEMKPSLPLVGARALTEQSNNLVLLLVDGREALVEMTGFPLWAALTIDMEEIERIEIIRGPGSTLYGANAFAAVVNITTVTEQPASSGEVLISGGEIGYHKLHGRVRNAWPLGDGRLSFGVSIGNEGRRGPSDRNAVELMLVMIRSHGYLRYRRGRDLDVSLHAGVMEGDGYVYLVLGDYTTQNVLNHYVTAKADIGLSENLKLQAQIYHARYAGDFHFRSTLKAQEQWLANVPDFNFDTNTADAQVTVDWQAADWLRLIGGSNFRFNRLDSDKITAESLGELRGAGFLQAQMQPWDVFQLTAGLRLDLNDRTDPAFSPRVALVFRPEQDHAVRLSYGLAFRKPAFMENQLHMQIDEYAFDEVLNSLGSSIGNEDLVSELVHSVEAGWRAHFPDERLKLSLDSFFNIYQNTIYFKRHIALNRFDLPDLPKSDFQFENADGNLYAFGCEIELVWSPSGNWNLWGNLGFRWVTDGDLERLRSEPVLRPNLGGRWISDRGLFIDLALHYVSSYDMPLVLPDKSFEEEGWTKLGNQWLLIGRIGYPIFQTQTGSIEAGITARTPIGAPFREYPGVEMHADAHSVSRADWGGEMLVRWFSAYLRGTF
jgi:iron complex outermembrane receptor protein